MGAPAMTRGMKGETVYMPEAFGIKSGKSPNFGRIKAITDTIMKAKGDDTNHLEQLFEKSDLINIWKLQDHIAHYLNKHMERSSAIEQLDTKIAKVNNLLFSLTCFFKQNYLFPPNQPCHDNYLSYFTKQEIAAKYRVSVRTITNWIASGLETTEIGGVLRISEQALDTFVKNNKRKKFKWRSVSNVYRGKLDG